MIRGLNKIKGKQYYFDDAGVMQTGWQTINGKKYYFDSDGTQKTGVVKIGNNKFRLFSKGGYQRIGWQTIKGETYYYKNGKKLKSCWCQLKNKYYRFGKTGVLHKNRCTVGGFTFLLESDGAWTGKVKGYKKTFKTPEAAVSALRKK